MAAYCAEGDLKLGRIPLPPYMDVATEIQDAADEIDSKIGMLYETPIDVSDTSSVSRPVRLLLKRLNANLASGRILMALSSPEENKNVHQYGLYLVTEATTALDMIVKGEITLDGVPDAAGGSTSTAPVSVPLIHNLDSESNVEAFYDRLANPSLTYAAASPNPDRFTW